MATEAYVVTITDRLYRVCRGCGVPQPHYVVVQQPKAVMTTQVAEVVTACCVCSRVHSTVSIDSRGNVTTS